MGVLDGLISLLKTVEKVMSLKYVVMDEHFGNYPSAWMVRQVKLHLVSKLRSNAALYPASKESIRAKVQNPSMLRRVLREGKTHGKTAANFGFSHVTFYQSPGAFCLQAVFHQQVGASQQDFHRRFHTCFHCHPTFVFLYPPP